MSAAIQPPFRTPGSLSPRQQRWRRRAALYGALGTAGVLGGISLLYWQQQATPQHADAPKPATSEPGVYKGLPDRSAIINAVANIPSPSTPPATQPAANATPAPPPPPPTVIATQFHKTTTIPDYLKPKPAPEVRPVAATTARATGNPESGIVYKAENLGGVTAFAIKHRELQLPQGSWLPCVLNNSIITGVSGTNKFTCNLSEDIKSPYTDPRTGTHIVLLDKGTVIDGEYMAAVQEGQYRVVAIANSARTPDPYGIAVSLQGEPIADQIGAAGVEGSVNEHWGRRIGAALALAFLDAGVAIGQAALQSNNGGTSVNIGSSIGQGGPFSQLGQSILQKEMNIPPTIWLKQGQTLMLATTRYIDFSGVYKVE